MKEQPIKKVVKTDKIRTFKNDLANAVKGGSVTTAKIAIKEQQRRRAMGIDGVEGKKKRGSKIIIIIVSFFFLFASIGIFITLKIDPSLSFLSKTPLIAPETKKTELFNDVSKVKITQTASKSSVFEMFDGLEENKKAGELKTFEFYINDEEKGEIPATAEQFFKYIQASPERLDKSIEKIIYGLDGENPFVLLELRKFQTAFAGMFDWEKTMTRDLEPVFQKIRETTLEVEIQNLNYIPKESDDVVDENEPEASNTDLGEESDDVVDENEPEASNTDLGEESDDVVDENESEILIKRVPMNWRQEKYYDKILFNKDSRVLRKNNGDEGIIYTFIDDNYILISTEISTIKTILEEINKYYMANY